MLTNFGHSTQVGSDPDMLTFPAAEHYLVTGQSPWPPISDHLPPRSVEISTADCVGRGGREAVPGRPGEGRAPCQQA